MTESESLSIIASALAEWAENASRPVTHEEIRAVLAELGHPRSLVTGVIAECIVKGRLQVDEHGNFVLGPGRVVVGSSRGTAAGLEP
jgi:hypothetical protein